MYFVTHLSHAQQVEFLVAAIYKFHKIGTHEPTVHQQILEWNLVVYCIPNHVLQFFSLTHKILFLSLRYMGVLVALTFVALSSLL